VLAIVAQTLAWDTGKAWIFQEEGKDSEKLKVKSKGKRVFRRGKSVTCPAFNEN
jgi:hypothetical protein